MRTTINWISLEGTVSLLMVRVKPGLTISTQPLSSSDPKSGLRDWYVLETYDTALSPLIQDLRPETRHYQKTRMLKECWRGQAENVPPASAEEVRPYAGTNGPDLHNHGWEGAQHLGSSLVRLRSQFWSEQAPLFFWNLHPLVDLQKQEEKKQRITDPLSVFFRSLEIQQITVSLSLPTSPPLTTTGARQNKQSPNTSDTPVYQANKAGFWFALQMPRPSFSPVWNAMPLTLLYGARTGNVTFW